MLIKSEAGATNPSSSMLVCGDCGAEERRLLHQVRHRGVFRRLCTNCILRLHPQAFCPSCFQVYSPTPPNDAVRVCVKCYSHSHSHCLESSSSSSSNTYVCPLCVNPKVPLFKLKPSADDFRVMDAQAARMLLAAAKIASASMNKAAVAAKAEAERRVKEAACTRKRAKEALEHVAHLVIKEKARRKEDVVVAGRIASNGVHRVAIKNGGGLPSLVVGEESVDRDSSNQVLAAALNAVELGGGMSMDVDDEGGMKKVDEVGDMKSGAVDDVSNNEMVLEKKQNSNGGEHVL